MTQREGLPYHRNDEQNTRMTDCRISHAVAHKIKKGITELQAARNDTNGKLFRHCEEYAV
jgi:hypothetical protein